jgi:hypothetical protein
MINPHAKQRERQRHPLRCVLDIQFRSCTSSATVNSGRLLPGARTAFRQRTDPRRPHQPVLQHADRHPQAFRQVIWRYSRLRAQSKHECPQLVPPSELATVLCRPRTVGAPGMCEPPGSNLSWCTMKLAGYRHGPRSLTAPLQNSRLSISARMARELLERCM